MRVGVIGLGVIGQPIAERLVAAGFETAVHDVNRERVMELARAGAQACASAAEIADSSDIVLSFVADAAQTDAILFGSGGMFSVLKPGAIFVTGSTLGPAMVRRFAEHLAARGCHMLDAPISGGYHAAREGTLSVMIGGDQVVIDRALPVFQVFAQVITRIGGVGAGQTAKLAHQLVLSINIMALLEGLALGKAGGVEPEVLRNVLASGLAGSDALRVWPELGARWKGMFSRASVGGVIPNLRKDLHLALELAQEFGVQAHVGRQASLVADGGNATGSDDPAL